MNHDALAIELADSDSEVRLSAMRRVVENQNVPLDDLALEALLGCLGAPRKVIQRRAAEALASVAPRDPRVVEMLRDALSDSNARARWGAAYALGLVNLDGALDLRALPILFEALASDDGDVRWAAAELVVRLGKNNRAAVGTGLSSLASGGNLNARKMALYCLRDVGGDATQILSIVESCCADHQSLIKMAALSLISRIADSGDRAANVALRLLESDSDVGVRRCAAVALGHIGNQSDRVIEALMRGASDGADIFMKRAAEGALKRLGVRG